MVRVIGIRPARLQNDVVRPDKAPVSAKYIQVRFTASWNVVFSQNKTSGGVTHWPGTQLERDLIRGARSANRSQVFGQRFNVLFLAKCPGSGRFPRDDHSPRPSPDD